MLKTIKELKAQIIFSHHKTFAVIVKMINWQLEVHIRVTWKGRVKLGPLNLKSLEL